MREQFKQIVAGFLDRPVTDTELELSLDQLGLDSLEVMELIMIIEEKMDATLDTSDLPIDCTFNDLFRRIGNQ